MNRNLKDFLYSLIHPFVRWNLAAIFDTKLWHKTDNIITATLFSLIGLSPHPYRCYSIYYTLQSTSISNERDNILPLYVPPVALQSELIWWFDKYIYFSINKNYFKKFLNIFKYFSTLNILSQYLFSLFLQAANLTQEFVKKRDKNNLHNYRKIIFDYVHSTK